MCAAADHSEPELQCSAVQRIWPVGRKSRKHWLVQCGLVQCWLVQCGLVQSGMCEVLWREKQFTVQLISAVYRGSRNRFRSGVNRAVPSGLSALLSVEIAAP